MARMNENTRNHFFRLLNKSDIEVHSMSIYEKGEWLFEEAVKPYELDSLHPLYSVTKSFTSQAIGLLVEDGLVGLDTPWIDYFPEYEVCLFDDMFKKVTVRHLLTMSMGQDCETRVNKDSDPIIKVLQKPVVYEPGTKFLYNSHCSHLLGALVSKVSGMKLAKFVEKRIFEPLGIEEYAWDEDKFNRSLGGFGLHLKIHDLAKFGVCCMHDGMYEGKQVLSKAYNELATSKQMENDYCTSLDEQERQGYGFQYWLCTKGVRCSGMFGQLVFMLKEEDLVITMHTTSESSKEILACLYEALKQEEVIEEEVLENPVLVGEEKSQMIYLFDDLLLVAQSNYFRMEYLTITQLEDGIMIACKRNFHTYRIVAKYNEWHKQKNQCIGFNPYLVKDQLKRVSCSKYTYANYAWLTPSTLAVRVLESDSTASTTLLLRFDEHTITMEYSVKGLWSQMDEATVVFG